MRVFASVLILMVALIFPSDPARSTEDIVKLTDDAVGFVASVSGGGMGTGSGFVLGQVADSTDLIFLTNYHVIEGGNSFYVMFSNDGIAVRYDGDVIATSPELDYAVLLLTKKDPRAFTPGSLVLARREVEKGEDVAASGFPGYSQEMLSKDSEQDEFAIPSLTKGSVSKVLTGGWTTDSAVRVVQHNADVNPGNSGGPLVDSCGQVVGLNTAIAKARDGATPPNGMYWASSSLEIINFLDSEKIPYRTAYSTCGAPGFPKWAYWALAGLLIAAIAGALFVILRANRGDRKPKPPAGDTVMVARLVDLQGGASARPVSLSAADLQRGVLIGRADSCHLHHENPRLSREHARLRIQNRKLLLQDMGSSHGTTVAGKALEPGKEVQINSASKVELAGALTLELRRP